MTSVTTGEQISSPNEFLDIPNWITEDYFQQILEKDVVDYRGITKFVKIAATAPGENYTSTMVRVIIDVELKDGSPQQVSYILKTSLDPGNSAFIHNLELFPKEKQMYAHFIPKFEQLYKDCGAVVNFGPKCLRFDETPEKITFVMEDLKRKQFGNIDRLRGFNMAHIQATLNKLAEFHAASAVYEEREGPYESAFHGSFINEKNRAIIATLYEPRMKLFHSALKEWGLEEPEKYIAKSLTFDEYIDEYTFLTTSDPNGFNVLNHGDCWANNIMFMHDECGEEIQEILFVDYQLCKWGSPAQDLWYLITTSVDMAIKVKEFDHFIQIYHKRLVECLSLLKYKKSVPSLKELHIMLFKYGYWGTFAAKNIAPIILFPSDKDANVESLMKTGPEADAFRFRIYTNPIYARAMVQFFPFLYNKGLLGGTVKKA